MGLLDSFLGDEADEDERIDTELTLSELCNMISNGRRAATIRIVAGYEGEIALSELADIMAELESGGTYNKDERKRAYVSLYQSHLPKMDETGIIAFDQDRGLIQAGPEFEVSVEALERLEPITADGPIVPEGSMAQQAAWQGLEQNDDESDA